MSSSGALHASRRLTADRAHIDNSQNTNLLQPSLSRISTPARANNFEVSRAWHDGARNETAHQFIDVPLELTAPNSSISPASAMNLV